VAGTFTNRITTLSPTGAGSFPISPRELESVKGRGEVNRMAVSRLLDYLRGAWRSEQGQTMAEYGVILAVVTVGIVAALTALSGGVQGAISNIVQTLTG